LEKGDFNLNFFSLSEFNSPDLKDSGKKMDKEFLLQLDFARELAGIPFKINSGYRTKKHNAIVGGRVGSSHLKGLAVDIAYHGSRERYLILHSLMKVGINRLGIGKSFIHADVDKNKDGNVVWLY
tara:strand:+ start:401 stop:775 length:375 start_codon:yes stop_codon:yes gene_type:complete